MERLCCGTSTQDKNFFTLADFQGQEVLAICFRGPMELLAVILDKPNGVARLESFMPDLAIASPK